MWSTFNDHYKCEKGAGTPILSIQGSEDKIHKIGGFLALLNEGTEEVIAPPSDYGPWYFANLNGAKNVGEAGAATFDTKLDEFSRVVTYEKVNDVDGEHHEAKCEQFFNPDGSDLEANITYCVANGGHIWWGS